MELEENPKYKEKNINSGFINLNKMDNIPNLKLKEINFNININIKGISDFYKRISEEARILPIYCLNYQN